MMMTHLVWNGTPEELLDLIRITEEICRERAQPCGIRPHGRCGAHALLVQSQRQLDDLVFARRMRDRLRAAEGL